MIYKRSKSQINVSVKFRLTTFFHSAIQTSKLAESTWFKDGLSSTKQAVEPDENTDFLHGKPLCLENKQNYYDFM